MIRLGIDTGGTFTDAVIVDTETMDVLASAKSLTTKNDLTRCISTALDKLPHDALMLAEHAALSTTLATNACVEGKGGRAKLIIVGTTDEILRRVDAQGKFGIPYNDVLAIDYVGSYDGKKVTIPDWEEHYAAKPAFFEEADSFGIASLYALNNGAVVEKSGAAFLREKFGKLVVEATTVAVEPNVIGRGATALLNARLVPVIQEFLDAIGTVFRQRGLDIPISIVRSDGSLMSEELARTRPVETILSGPAASVTGAQALAGAPESLVVDIGGTTSDISIVHGGQPNHADNIAIGGWKTQVSGVRIDTIALGGDTVVRFTKNSRLELGERRVTPLCIAASRWPQVIDALERYYRKIDTDFQSYYELLYLLKDPGDASRFTRAERQLIDVLGDGPVSLFDKRMDIIGLKTDRLESEGVVMRIGMTPTDAMHLKGDFDEFDTRASRLGAQCVLKSYRGAFAAEDPEAIEALADEIYNLAQFRLYGQVTRAFVQDHYWPDGSFELDDQMRSIVERTWVERHAAKPAPFTVRFASDATLVGVGAPTHVFLGEVAQAMGAPFAIPKYAGVANAVGAAVSRVFVEKRVHVNPLRGMDGVIASYQVRGADDSKLFRRVEDALEAAREMARNQAVEEARRRGSTEELTCEIEESRSAYAAMGVADTVKEWIITAHVS